MPTLGTSGLGRPLRKTTTFVVGTWEQSLSLLPINSSICVYQAATENGDRHWACWVREGRRSLWRQPLLQSKCKYEPRDLHLSGDYVTSSNSLTPLSLKLGSRTPTTPPTWRTTDTMCVWTRLGKHEAGHKWKHSSWPITENTDPVDLRRNQVNLSISAPFSPL